jgi:hypothetical protein
MSASKRRVIHAEIELPSLQVPLKYTAALSTVFAPLASLSTNGLSWLVVPPYSSRSRGFPAAPAEIPGNARATTSNADNAGTVREDERRSMGGRSSI